MWTLGTQRQSQWAEGCRSAVLRGQGDDVLAAAQVEVRVAPGMEFGAAAQRLAGAEVTAGFSGVMDQDDRDREATLQVAQISQKGRDLARGVFIDAVQADKGVEHQQDRTEGLQGVRKARLIGRLVQTQRRGGD